MVEWKEADMVSALFVVCNGKEIRRHRLVRRELEHDSVILFKETVDLFNSQWHYNNSLIVVIYKRSLSHNVTSCPREFIIERFASVVPLIKEETKCCR
jgi:hypothetical protein